MWASHALAGKTLKPCSISLIFLEHCFKSWIAGSNGEEPSSRVYFLEEAKPVQRSYTD